MLGRLDDLRQVEAKYPALLFKQQLTAFLEKIYGMIRDNLKKEISPLISLCIQVTPSMYTAFMYDPLLSLSSYNVHMVDKFYRNSLNAPIGRIKSWELTLSYAKRKRAYLIKIRITSNKNLCSIMAACHQDGPLHVVG